MSEAPLGWEWKKLRGYPASHLVRESEANGMLESYCGIVMPTKKHAIDRRAGEFDMTIPCYLCKRLKRGEILSLIPDSGSQT